MNSAVPQGQKESPIPVYDLAVIGSGPGGYRAAVLAALRGLRVAIIEKQVWGGCCLNRGCVPKKDWYHTARLMASQSRFAGRGIQGHLQVDLLQAWQHQHEVVNTVRGSYMDYLRHLKVDTYSGHARFVDPQHLEIQEAESGTLQMLHMRNSIIATGSQPYVPEPFHEIPGKILTTDSLFASPPPPGRRVLVIGSGVIATEFSFILKMLGWDVTWLTRSEPLHRMGYSPQALNVLKSRLAEAGITPRRVSGYASVSVQEEVRLVTNDQEVFHADWVLLGTGRTPCSRDLGLDNLGITTDSRGFIARDDDLQTTVPGIYAIGDVAADWMTANHALSDATLAVANILGERRQQDGRFVPVTVYSAMEMARLGLDEEAAEDAEREPAVGFAAFETSPRALGQDEAEGFVRLIGDMDSGELLGGEVIGAEAGELIHLLSLAPNRESAFSWIARGTWNHPARSEEFLNAVETLAAKWNLREAVFGK